MDLTSDTGNNGDSSGVRFADDRAAEFLSAHLAELAHPDRGERFERIKRNASRTVYRGQIGDQTVYVKHFHPRTLSHRLARRLGVSGAMREMDRARRLMDSRIETPAMLAALCRDGQEWVATRAVEPAEPADAWHERQLRLGAQGRRAIRQGLLALAEMVGRMHAAGICHRDLHCANVLVRTDSPRPRLVLMDLHRMTCRRRLSRRARAANLALLFHDRFDFTTRTQRLRFLKAYLAVSEAEGSLRGWQLLVEHFARRHTARQLAQRDKRITRRNKYFSPIRLPGGWRGHVNLANKWVQGGSRAARLEFTAEQWREALADPRALLDGDAEGARVVKDSRSSLVIRRKITVGARELDVYVKQPRRKRWWKFVADCFRASRPTRAFRLGHHLLHRRIATALPLAALEKRLGPLLIESILITEAVEAPPLDAFMRTWLGTPPKGDTRLTVPQQRQLAQEGLAQLGRLVQKLHDNRFAHRDLKSPNLLIRWSPPEPAEVVLVDLDGLTRLRFVTTRRRFQGLMRLNVSLLKCPEVNHAGRLRMLLGYLRRPGCGRICFKPYWRVLEQWSDRKLEQQIRSRRKRQRVARRPA